MTTAQGLPPGQHAADLERFGLPQYARRHVKPPTRSVLTIGGDVRNATKFDLDELLYDLPRREQRSDLHCVTTWSALDLIWAGVPFQDLEQRISEIVRPHPHAHWLVATGLDGFQSCLLFDDAIAEDVLLADHLHGSALSPDHGSPVRLVAPQQYGYKSVKHLVALDYRRSYTAGSAGFKGHPRGRVAREERSRLLPGPLWRRVWAIALPAARRPFRANQPSQ